MPVRVLLEVFESMGRIWAQMLISIALFHVCLLRLHLGCSIIATLFLSVLLLEYHLGC